jgi:ABC-type dipeptide/oligopeptide/nickel transport system permease component
MLVYTVRRLLLAVPLLLLASLVVFAVVANLPGDPCAEKDKYKTPEAQAGCRGALNLDGPFLVRYGRYLSRAARMDFGHDVMNPQLDVGTELMKRFPATIELSVVALTLAFLLGTFVGTRSALRPGTWIDALGQVLSLGGVSIPVFWLGMLLMGFLGVELGWFPFKGWNPSDFAASDYHQTRFWLFEPLLRLDFAVFLRALHHMGLAALALSTIPLATITRMTRSAMLDEVGKDYVTTARAKGLPESRVIGRHVRRNALIPIVTITGLQLGTLLSGAVLTEHVFGWDAVGSYMVEGALRSNQSVLAGCLLLFVTIFIMVNLVVDILYGLIDPRIRHARGG